MTTIKTGTWVELQKVVLTPAERAPNVPEDTKQVPYIMRVSGFLLEDAELGQATRIKTIIGRELDGTLITINPSYSHSFGKVVPEMLKIGTEGEAL